MRQQQTKSEENRIFFTPSQPPGTFTSSLSPPPLPRLFLLCHKDHSSVCNSFTRSCAVPLSLRLRRRDSFAAIIFLSILFLLLLVFVCAVCVGFELLGHRFRSCLLARRKRACRNLFFLPFSLSLFPRHQPRESLSSYREYLFINVKGFPRI